jgi:hypothetical protein
MRFNGVTTDLLPTPTGIPQGSLLSSILYIFYNSDLLNIPKKEKQLGWDSLTKCVILLGLEYQAYEIHVRDVE